MAPGQSSQGGTGPTEEDSGEVRRLEGRKKLLRFKMRTSAENLENVTGICGGLVVCDKDYSPRVIFRGDADLMPG